MNICDNIAIDACREDIRDDSNSGSSMNDNTTACSTRNKSLDKDKNIKPRYKRTKKIQSVRD